jgi:biotin operon repressor
MSSQDQFEADIRKWVGELREDGFRIFSQPARKIKGDMIMFAEGDVAVYT